jgi:hypothetical protein
MPNFLKKEGGSLLGLLHKLERILLAFAIRGKDKKGFEISQAGFYFVARWSRP